MLAFIDRWIGVFWIVCLALWWLSAILSKHSIQSQSSGSRVLQLAFGIAGVILLFNLLGASKSLWINAHVFPHTAPWAMAGSVLTLAGVLFAVWARTTLGRNWSARVTIKHNHELVVRGPYTFVRHPIYTGIITGLLGTALIYGDIRGLMGVLVYALGLWLKSRTEERFMLQQFDGRYAEYRRHTKALVPFVL